ncbi:MAG: tmk [Alphaproteobacteria bacterium]|nr:tmk [Alphaproteobacteria bacterium]
MSNKAPFITFEGGEGSGKTTQIRLLKTWLEDKGKYVTTTREPGGTVGAEAIRDLIVQKRDNQWDAETDALLLMAARRDHLVHLIWPSLEQGHWVLSDRFVESTYAYQCFGRDLPLEKARELYRFIAGDFKPDLTFILDIDPRDGLDRALTGKHRNRNEERFENFDFSFHENLRAGYHELAKQEPQRFIIIDAAPDCEHVQAQLQAAIEKRFSL